MRFNRVLQNAGVTLESGTVLEPGVNIVDSHPTIPADGVTVRVAHFAAREAGPHVWTITRGGTTTTVGPATPTHDVARALYWTELPLTASEACTITVAAEVQGLPSSRGSDTLDAIAP